MNDLNHVVLIGNITRTVGETQNSFGYLQNGTCRANVSIAVNRSVKKGDEWGDEVSYFDIVIWGKIAESLKKYLVKGQKIAVEGVLKQERWQTQNGENKSRVVINAQNVQLIGSKQNAENQSNGQNYQNNYQGNSKQNNGQYQNYRPTKQAMEAYRENPPQSPMQNQPMNEQYYENEMDFQDDIPF